MLDHFQESTFLLETFDKHANAWVIVDKHGVMEQFSSTGQLATFGLADLAIGANAKGLFIVDLNLHFGISLCISLSQLNIIAMYYNIHCRGIV